MVKLILQMSSRRIPFKPIPIPRENASIPRATAISKRVINSPHTGAASMLLSPLSAYSFPRYAELRGNMSGLSRGGTALPGAGRRRERAGQKGGDAGEYYGAEAPA
ncbi:hypothetical protein N6H14_10660 [Paenibacillus sp. CC-CFT747]|nr:hypothetical protein N6H14_10660 [Paenibacillus sp. CC-CFT747]